MKNLSFLVLTVALAIGVVSCGGKDNKSGDSGSFSTDPYKVTTVKGLVNVDNYQIRVGSQTYQPDSQSMQIVANAVIEASRLQIPLNSARQLKINVTGSLSQAGYPQGGYQQGGMQGGFQQGGYQQGGMQGGYPQGGNTLNIQQAVVYR